MSETLVKARTDIVAMAVDGFKDHQIRLVQPGLWKCSRPNSWIYGFFVAALPGALVFYGDLGEAVLRPSDTDVIPWLRGAVRSEGYLLEKVKPRPEQAFYPGDAVAWAAERVNEGGATVVLDDARQMAKDGELNRYTWSDLVYEHTGEAEDCAIGSGPSAASLWLVQALRWFVAHLDQVQE